MLRHAQKLWLIIPCMLAGPMFLFSQSTEIDSMRNVLQDTNLSDSARMETLLQLGWDMSFYDTEKARGYLNECISLATKNGDANMVGSGFTYIGSSFLMKTGLTVHCITTRWLKPIF